MRMRLTLAVLCAVALSMPWPALFAQEHEYHKNHGAAFLGATTHTDPKDTGFTLGVEYARRFSRFVAVGVMVEMASSRLERDIILGLPVIVYPWQGLALTLGPGVEAATEEEEHGEEIKEVTKAEFLMRFGVGYWFALNETVAAAPAIFADVAGERWSLVYGIVFGVGW